MISFLSMVDRRRALLRFLQFAASSSLIRAGRKYSQSPDPLFAAANVFAGPIVPVGFAPFYRHRPVEGVVCTECHELNKRGRFRFEGSAVCATMRADQPLKRICCMQKKRPVGFATIDRRTT